MTGTSRREASLLNTFDAGLSHVEDAAVVLGGLTTFGIMFTGYRRGLAAAPVQQSNFGTTGHHDLVNGNLRGALHLLLLPTGGAHPYGSCPQDVS